MRVRMGQGRKPTRFVRLRNGFVLGCCVGVVAAVSVLTFIHGAVDPARLVLASCAVAGSGIGLLPRRHGPS